MFFELKLIKPIFKFTDRHLNKLGNASSAHLYPCGFFLQFGSMTVRTYSLSPVPTHHYTILNLILVLFHHLEKGINADFIMYVFSLFTGQSMPKHVFVFAVELIVRFKYREVICSRTSYEFRQPSPHFITMPALYTAVIDTECRVGNDKFLINSNNVSKAFARWTGTQWRVE